MVILKINWIKSIIYLFVTGFREDKHADTDISGDKAEPTAPAEEGRNAWMKKLW